MVAFAKVVKAVRAPGRTLVLEPWVFADEWEDKPKAAVCVCVGLRLMSEVDKLKARVEAERLADELHPGRGEYWVDACNDAIMRQVVALGICDPNDVTKPAPVLPYAEEKVRYALTSRGVRFIFEAIDRYELESSPIGTEATGAVLADLAALLPTVKVEELRPGLRRLIHHVFEELGGEL